MRSNEIYYKISWRSRGYFPGFHASEQRGAGLRFRNHVPLIDAPDPRRFDARASLKDPFEQIQVKVFQQTSSIPVYVVADLSASMTYAGTTRKIETVADLVQSLSYSAYRTGDTFGFIGCADTAFETIVVPPTLNRASGLALAERLRNLEEFGSSSRGLLRAADLLGSRRALIFLVSDFHFDFDILEKTLAAFAYHDVVPVVLWDKKEFENLPNFGVVRVVDPETGRDRLLFMRAALKARIAQQFHERRQRLDKIFSHNGRAPLFIEKSFNPDDVSKYFLG